MGRLVLAVPVTAYGTTSPPGLPVRRATGKEANGFLETMLTAVARALREDATAALDHAPRTWTIYVAGGRMLALDDEQVRHD